MTPPSDESIDFMRLRISRQFESQLIELGTLLNHRSPSQTVEYLLTRNLVNEIFTARRLLGDKNN